MEDKEYIALFEERYGPGSFEKYLASGETLTPLLKQSLQVPVEELRKVSLVDNKKKEKKQKPIKTTSALSDFTFGYVVARLVLSPIELIINILDFVK